MIKFNSELFLQNFVKDHKLLNPYGCLTSLTHKDVVEFKIGNKYFYKLDDNSSLNVVHDDLCREFLNLVPVNNSATAYRCGMSYLNLFEPHRNGFYFLRLDISSFFYSIQEKLIRDRFSDHFKDDYFKEEYVDRNKKQTLLDGFISLTTYKIPENSLNERFRNKVVLPIGFKTSPVISNIVFRKIDILIQKYCVSKNIVYSRYADDMLFSSSEDKKFVHSVAFYHELKYFLSIDGFKINKRKTVRSKHTVSLNGYVVRKDDFSYKASSMSVSNKKTKIINKLLFLLGKGEKSEYIMSKLFGFRRSPKNFNFYPPSDDYVEKFCKTQIHNKIAGYRSFLISIIKFNERYYCVNDLAIRKYTKLIDSLNKHI